MKTFSHVIFSRIKMICSSNFFIIVKKIWSTVAHYFVHMCCLVLMKYVDKLLNKANAVKMSSTYTV